MKNFERRVKKLRTSMARLPDKLTTIAARLSRNPIGGAHPPIAFKVDGGMGDHIIAARFIRDIAASIEGLQFDIYCKRPKIMQWLMASVPGCNLIGEKKMDIKMLRRRYRYVFNTVTFVQVVHDRSRKRRAANPAEVALDKLAKLITLSCKPIQMYIHNHPQLDGYLGHYTVLKESNRHRYLHVQASLPYTGDLLDIEVDAEILKRLALQGQQYITMSNGYDELVETNSSTKLNTKVYPHYSEVALQLKAAMPGVKLVQIGTTTSTPIQGIDVDLIGKTSLPEVAAILKHAQLHIDNEGGLVHLAASVGTRACVIFGPTLADYFGYETNLNIAPKECGSCWWMEPTWMVKCVKGYEKPVCMHATEPDSVANRILEHLRPRQQLKSIASIAPSPVQANSAQA